MGVTIVTSLMSPSVVGFKKHKQDGLKFEVAIYSVHNFSLIECHNTDDPIMK